MSRMRGIVAALAALTFGISSAQVVSMINAELNLLLNDAGIRELLAKQGMTPAGGLPERLGELVRRELTRWTRVVNAAGIKAD